MHFAAQRELHLSMTATPPIDQARTTAEAVARSSYGKLVAYLAARTRDVAAAEDALSEAFASALAAWPVKGCPDNPEAWLLTAARRKLIDSFRTQHADPVATQELDRMIASTSSAAPAIPDERLAMIFACAHPAIDPTVRAPLILQVVLGLDAKAIAAAFLTSPAAMGKRLVRAKIKIREAGIPFRVPEPGELAARLDTVLDTIYAAYSEGWSDPAATDASLRDLAEEAIFLARLLVDLMPGEPEALGLLALLLHTEARRSARRQSDDSEPEFVPLNEQDSDLWNLDLMLEAESLLHRAASHGTPGRFQLQAALQSAHVDRIRNGRSNWSDIVALYDALYALTASPVVAINRAVASSQVDGPLTALAALDALASDPELATRLAEYQPWWASRADLLARTGAHADARRAYSVAIGLERDLAVRRFLERRQAALPV